MSYLDLEHPDITSALLTGYPLDNQPSELRCERCGDLIEDEVYQDESHDCLCLECLKDLHIAERW